MTQKAAKVREEKNMMGSSFSNSNKGKRTSHYTKKAGLFLGLSKTSAFSYESTQNVHKDESALLNKSLNLLYLVCIA